MITDINFIDMFLYACICWLIVLFVMAIAIKYYSLNTHVVQLLCCMSVVLCIVLRWQQWFLAQFISLQINDHDCLNHWSPLDPFASYVSSKCLYYNTSLRKLSKPALLLVDYNYPQWYYGLYEGRSQMSFYLQTWYYMDGNKNLEHWHQAEYFHFHWTVISPFLIDHFLPHLHSVNSYVCWKYRCR